LLALTKEIGGTSPSVVRLRDVKGSVIAHYDTDPTFVRFASQGALVVWGAKEGSRNAFVSVLNQEGAVTASYEHPDKEINIHDVAASADASIVAVLEGPRAESFPDRVTVWNTATNFRAAVRPPTELGVIQSNPSVSARGQYAAVMLGATGICLIKTSPASVVLATNLQPPLPAGGAVKAVLEVSPSDDGSFAARCLITAPEGESTKLLKFDKQGRLLD